MAPCPLSLAAVVVILVAAGGVDAGVFRCCTPTQWRAHVRTLRQSVRMAAGTEESQEILQIVNYDGQNERVSVVERAPDNSLVRKVFDYQKMVSYEIIDERLCSHTPLTKAFRSLCLSENVTAVYFAGIGGRLAENTAYFTDSDATGYVIVTIVNCALVAEVIYSIQDGEAVSENVQYLNETLSVDPASFWIPPFCPTVTASAFKHPLTPTLGMLASLLSP